MLDEITIQNFLINISVSIIIGLLISFAYMYKTKYTKSFVITLSILPTIVSTIILFVNGNLGTGVALTGVFSLVRFRSVPGSAKEIGAIFLAMSAGLTTGMGYIYYALLFVIIVSTLTIIYTLIGFGEIKSTKKILKVTIPENLDYSDWINDLLSDYTKSNDLLGVKTTNMGSLLKLEYEIELKDISKEKEFVDNVRCRNGNLEISISRQSSSLRDL